MIKSILQKFVIVAGLSLIALAPGQVQAAGGGVEIPQQQWPHKTSLGKYDKAALQRGFQIYRENCSSCHSLELLSYRNLASLGYNEAQIKAVASEATVIDGPNDEGDMFERPGRPADRFQSPFENPEQARFANNGAFPPDMSLLIKARPGGEDYIYALLTGYTEAPANVDLKDGMYWNTYFPGHQIAMAPPIAEGLISYSDGTEASVEQAARDVTQFLAWASEPHMEHRKTMGIKILMFLAAFSVIAYIAKRKMWADVH